MPIVNTIIGVLIGMAATVAITHYYFRRTTKKSLGIYKLLISHTFTGIEQELREQLRFTYQNKEIEDLLQIEFIVANDGEKAISNVIEPLRFTLPEGVQLLNASVLHRHPNSLDASIELDAGEENSDTISFRFPLLNKGDFFVVKLLLNGQLESDNLEFSLLADDLPRSLRMRWIPPSAFHQRKLRPEWAAITVGLIPVGLAVWLGWVLILIKNARPELSPIPWSDFTLSLESAVLILPAIVLLIALGFIGIALIVSIGFDEFSTTGPRFPLPKELRNRARFPFRIMSDEIEIIPDGVEKPDDSNNPT